MLTIARAAVFAALLAAPLACAANPPRQTPASCDQTAQVRNGEAAASRAQCATLAGLEISGGAPLDLSPLATVARINGDLVVGPSSQLTSLHGLGGISVISGDLRITSNFGLGGAFLAGLESVSGDVVIAQNVAMSGVSLPALARVGGSVRIVSNASLETLLAPSLIDVGGDFEVVGSPSLLLLELSPSLTVRGTRHIDQPNSAIPESLSDP